MTRGHYLCDTLCFYCCRFHIKFFDSILFAYVLHAPRQSWVQEWLTKLHKELDDENAQEHATNSKAALKNLIKNKDVLEKTLGKEDFQKQLKAAEEV